MNKLFSLFAPALVLGVALFPLLAVAADVITPVMAASTVTAYSADLSPLAQTLLYMIGTVLTILLILAVRWVNKHYSLLTQTQESLIEDQIRKWVAEGATYAYGKLKDKDDLSINTKYQAVAAGAEFVTAQVPNLLKKYGLTDSALEAKIEAALTKTGIGDATTVVSSPVGTEPSNAAPVAGVTTATAGATPSSAPTL